MFLFNYMWVKGRRWEKVQIGCCDKVISHASSKRRSPPPWNALYFCSDSVNISNVFLVLVTSISVWGFCSRFFLEVKGTEHSAEDQFSRQLTKWSSFIFSPLLSWLYFFNIFILLDYTVYISVDHDRESIL